MSKSLSLGPPLFLFFGIVGACGGSVTSSNQSTSSAGSGGHGGVAGSATASTSVSSGHGGGGADAGRDADGTGGQGSTTVASSSGTGGVSEGGVSEGGVSEGGVSEGGVCAPACSGDNQAVVDCNGNVLAACPAGQGCDLTTVSCTAACAAAADNKQSVGCDFYATRMDMALGDQCYAAFIANTWSAPVHIAVDYYPGTPLPVATFARIPSGVGSSITYAPYDAAAGLPPGQVAILFLAGSPTSSVPCPAGVAATAVPSGSLVQGTGKGRSFHITTDLPVAAYQMNPYGGGSAGIPGASLLLPTSTWDTNYVAVTAAPYSAVTMGPPSLNVVAMADNTQITVLPSVAIAGGAGLPAGPANTPYTFTLNQGQQAQLSQQADLSGSILQATSPIGVMAGNACMQEPIGTSSCDHGEQMLPPVKALGNEYVGVMFRPRVTGDQAFWRLVGAVDGTALTYVPAAPAGAPTTLNAGQVVEFSTSVPFVVSSQNNLHPFLFFTLMSGSQWTSLATPGYGDPDFVLGVPSPQYLRNYVFFADETFPETNLVLVRAKDKNGSFDDITLDCMTGPVAGWQALGNYEWTRVDLMRHDFQPQGNCSSGRHQISSSGPFGLSVWGWGSPETSIPTSNVSYGYPGGMNVQPINPVVIPPIAH